MASSENLANVQPWTFRSAFADSLISEAFALDTESLTRALEKSLTEGNLDFLPTDTISPFFNPVNPDTAPTTPTVSGLSGGSEPDTATQKRQRNTIATAGGKISKRKSRASKKSQTTFIAADAANFRHMVQQVTGVRLGNSHVPVVPILKPEPQRPGGRIPGAGCLPTLDTSAFLLDQQQQQQTVRPKSAAGAVSSGVSGTGPLSFGSNMALADGSGVGGLDFDTFPSFPTLESWKVV
ncbi:hypothetical protein F2P56_009780 [Juglans regia]|uniref:VQ domain-containing protein n=2 Tax=Juglans regia TaxID=51240 RepID=A0A833XY00_JUGRE|nr:calmodulin-binding protein 25-like [Juglans regia]KAF5473152.1 hypothetical protein F2P56_009780 [Juglans regia]